MTADSTDGVRLGIIFGLGLADVFSKMPTLTSDPVLVPKSSIPRL
jgi:hypothetical protein